jgi:hypothetical protein
MRQFHSPRRSKQCHPERARTPDSKYPGARRSATSVTSFTAISVTLCHMAGRRILGVLRLGRSPSLSMTAITFALAQSGPYQPKML